MNEMEIAGINEDDHYVDANGDRVDDIVRMSFEELNDAISNVEIMMKSGIPFEVRNQMLGYLQGTFQHFTYFVKYFNILHISLNTSTNPNDSIGTYNPSDNDDTFWKAYNAIDKTLEL